MKKILSLVLAALMIFSVLPVAFADEAVAEEVAAEVSEYQAAIDFLKLLGIYKGDGTGDAADEAVTRWQMALFTARFITAQVDANYWATEENDSGFTDVEDFEGASEEALGAISFASQKGIVNGVGDGLFDPETGVQYREAITMIVRSLGYTYKASGYPWSYINKAREIGLLDGITGISYTEQINREVVAQLLYNALFVEIDGTNVAESAFNVGATVVLITATNKVAYYDEATVLRSNYVRFQELNAQGEPAGAQYHVSYDKFGLANGALAADAAVGTAYFVYYVNGCADIIYAESLTTVYENRGAEAPVAYSTSGSNAYLTIAGSKYQIVSLYNELNKDQKWNKDSAGTAQVKVYTATGKAAINANSQYIVDSFNNVWVADSAAANGYSLYAQYSAVMDKYYRIGTDGAWQILDLEDILTSAGSKTGAFNQITSVNSKLAYADFTVTDASMDGNADRVTVKQYGFGQITYGNRKNKDNKDQEYFSITAVEADGDATMSVNTTSAAVLSNTYNSGKSTGFPFTADFRWTGMARADVAKNAYVLYYVDEANKEVDILKVVDSDPADGTYTVKGYLRGYDAANDVVYLDADYTTYTLGYDNLFGSPLKDKSVSKTNDNLQNNINIVQPLVNTYVTLVIVDNKVVKIDNAGSTADYVIIDSFVAFEEDGIVANAWTTVSNEYTQIKINELNGWTVGGFDYYLYFLSGLFAGGQYADIIPVKADTLYQVVYHKDGVYNLTLPTSYKDQDLTVNAYGYIEGTKGDGSKFGDQYYVQTNAKDYWLILVEDADLATAGAQPQVISYSGVLNPVVKIDGHVYKAASNDYVVVVSDLSKVTGFNNLSGKVTQYMMYNDKVSGIENNYLFIQTSAYSWSVLMKDVLTGAAAMVAIDPALVPAGWNGKNYAQIGLTNGAIYTVVDGKLLKTTGNEQTFADVAAFYGATADYTEGTLTVNTDATRNGIRTSIATVVVNALFPTWGNKAEMINAYDDKVVVYAQTTDSYKFLTSDETTINNILKAAGSEFVVNYVYKKDGSAVAWINAGVQVAGTATVAKSVIAAAAPADWAAVTGEAEGLAAIKPTVTWTLDTATGMYTYKLLFDESALQAQDVETISYSYAAAWGTGSQGAADGDADGIWGEDDSLTTNTKLTSITVSITRTCGYNLYYVINF